MPPFIFDETRTEQVDIRGHHITHLIAYFMVAEAWLDLSHEEIVNVVFSKLKDDYDPDKDPFVTPEMIGDVVGSGEIETSQLANSFRDFFNRIIQMPAEELILIGPGLDNLCMGCAIGKHCLKLHLDPQYIKFLKGALNECIKSDLLPQGSYHWHRALINRDEIHNYEAEVISLSQRALVITLQAIAHTLLLRGKEWRIREAKTFAKMLEAKVDIPLGTLNERMVQYLWGGFPDIYLELGHQVVRGEEF